MSFSRVALGATVVLAALVWIAPAHGQDGLVVDDAGNVGIGTDEPSESLHVKGENARVLVEETGDNEVLFTLKRADTDDAVRFSLVRGDIVWTFDSFAQNFRILRVADVGNEFILSPAGVLSLEGGIITGASGAGNGNSTINGDLTVTGTINNSSSRSVKDRFEPVDEKAVLEKLLALPVLEWQYKRDQDGERHVGPLAEDFQEAFGLSDGKYISTVDASGVAMAAIKGLSQVVDSKEEELQARVRAKEMRIEALEQTNRDLAERLAMLEERVAGTQPTSVGSGRASVSPTR